MSRPTPPRAFAAMLSAPLLLAGIALLTSADPGFGQPPAKQPKEKPGGVPELRLRFEAEVKAAEVATPSFDHEGKFLHIMERQKLETVSVNTRTGAPGPVLPATDRKGRLEFAAALQNGRRVFWHSAEQDALIWDTATGKTSLVPAGVRPGEDLLNLSPNGQYAATGQPPANPPRKTNSSQLRVTDLKTGREVLSLKWMPGRVFFTADSLRALVVDATDRFQWFTLRTGQPDRGKEWAHEAEPSGFNARVLSLSADGKVILYSGTPPKRERGLYLLDGTNGDVLHSFPPKTYHTSYGFVSPDGESVVMIRTDGFGTGHAAEVLDRRGKLLARVAAPVRFTLFTVSWEAGAIAMYDRDARKVWLHDLPGVPATAVAVRPKARASGARTRSPVPGDAAVAKAEAAVRQILKDEYSRKQPAERKALAQKLLTLAAGTPDDPAARYVMLRDAQEQAVGVADPALALQAIGELAGWYQIEASAQQLASLEKILVATYSPATVKFIIDFAGPACDAAAEVDEFDDAVEFAQLAAAAVRKAKLGQLATDEADHRVAQAKKARDAFAAIHPALEKLSTAPDDPVANTTVGKYRCLVQNRWDDGLKYLARSQDAALRAAAELDLKAARTGVPADTKVADAWWDYARSAPADEQWAVQGRTRYWYARCLPGLTGLVRAGAEERLKFTAGPVEYRPGLIREVSAKQPSVLRGKRADLDPVIDFSGGEFAEGAKVTDLTVKWTGVLLPPQAGRYTLSAQTGDPVRVRVGDKVVIDTTSARGTRKEAPVMLGERPAPIVVEFLAPNTDRHKLKLAWTLPGKSTDEVIPADHLFHDKKAESVLGK